MANILRFGLLISIQGMGWALVNPFHTAILQEYQGPMTCWGG